MKQALKIAVVAVVILGLLATYVLSGLSSKTSQSNFQGPSSAPYTSGPYGPPPS